MPKLEIFDLILETTRRCNMKCDHCLRGKAENIDMNMDIITPILDNTASINTITFSGGEPTLNVPFMYDVLSYVQNHNIQVNSFYIVTNGKIITDNFLLLLHKWYNYICQYDDPEYSGICLSKDIFHEEIPKENEYALRSFSFFKDDKITDWTAKKYAIIQEGYATNLPEDKYSFWKKPKESNLYVEENPHTGNYTIDEQLYISAKGDIVADCDYSYDHILQYAIGNTKDIESFFEYLKEQTN